MSGDGSGAGGCGRGSWVAQELATCSGFQVLVAVALLYTV